MITENQKQFIERYHAAAKEILSPEMEKLGYSAKDERVQDLITALSCEALIENVMHRTAGDMEFTGLKAFLEDKTLVSSFLHALCVKEDRVFETFGDYALYLLSWPDLIGYKKTKEFGQAFGKCLYFLETANTETTKMEQALKRIYQIFNVASEYCYQKSPCPLTGDIPRGIAFLSRALIMGYGMAA